MGTALIIVVVVVVLVFLFKNASRHEERLKDHFGLKRDDFADMSPEEINARIKLIDKIGRDERDVNALKPKRIGDFEIGLPQFYDYTRTNSGYGEGSNAWMLRSFTKAKGGESLIFGSMAELPNEDLLEVYDNGIESALSSKSSGDPILKLREMEVHSEHSKIKTRIHHIGSAFLCFRVA